MQNLTIQYIEQLLQQQKQFFLTGKTLSLAYRKVMLNKLKQAILHHQQELEQALFADLGKSKQECYTTEIGFVLQEISHTLKHLKKWTRPKKVKSPMTVYYSKSYITKQPFGSTLIVGPFNYPFQLLIAPLVASLSAGNCAVLSPSELTPNTAGVIQKLINTTFDKQYVYCVEGSIENNTILINSKFDKIFFTGSTKVGKIVMQAASNNLVPVTLELGGKSPVVVTKEANIDVACQRIVWGKFMNAGQTCVAPDYVFVHNSIKQIFVDKLKQTILDFYGKDTSNNRDYGRIVNLRHIERLSQMLQNDKDSIVFGGQVDKAQRYIAPTLLCPDNIDTASCMQEEIFGPLLPVFGYNNIIEPLQYINAHDKPLALYIFSQNSNEIEYILSNTSSGGVSVNDTVSHIINQNLPFGGIGQSGMGCYHGEYGFLQFTHLRSVLRRSTRIKLKLAFPPFSDKKLNAIKKFMK